MANDFKDTLSLPKTDFPMRAGLPQREPARVAHWEKIGLYATLQKRREGAPVYVLHDGPPFTNGDVHVGTALNKTLKDIIVRYKSMRGFRAPFVPGWDCHGLPIEQKVARDFQEKKRTVSTVELRRACDEFSEGWIAKQTAQFQRLGVTGDWENPYRTKAPAYEADILRSFAAFVEQGLVYRSKKPVYWSIPFETALAEAEVEYKEHLSPSIWVAFPVPPEEARKHGLPDDKPLSIVIWTTTPWTLPANLAIAVHPKTDYVVADLSGAKPGRYVVAKTLLNAFAAKIGGESAQAPKVLAEFPGERLAPGGRIGLRARHPFIDRESPVVLADYVTTESGTGAVHTAPGHGIEDYQTGLKYGLEIYCLVGDDGRFVDDGRVPADLAGLSTLESVEDLEKKRTSAANVAVLKKLDAAGALLAREKFSHSYPHCWRSKTPIIFRAVDQWFVSLDRSGTRARALEAIGKVEWIPGWGEARIRGAVESRPDWCISRQRAWGVPIPAFYGGDGRPYLDSGVVRGIADKIAKAGSNLWYDASNGDLLSGVPLPGGWPPPAALTRGKDTLDVWFDSGSSHAAVLRRGQGGTRAPADLYLEGSDQHRGWFQSSLWTSVVSTGAAPYKAVLTHGFIVDEDRRKISKSSTYEKPQTSDAYIAEHGADVLRLWIASQDFRDDIPISKEILSHVSESYRQMRNTLRYQLSNLHDFDPAADAVPFPEMDALDRWALGQTAALVRQCTEAYDACEFHKVYQYCRQFCTTTLSAVYHDILKDRLYTFGPRSRLRRSSQTAIHEILRTLLRLLAPILPFTADEAWSFAATKTEFGGDSVHLQDWPEPPAAWTDPSPDEDFAALSAIRAAVNEAIEPLRAAGALGKSLDASVTLQAGAETTAGRVLKKFRGSLDFLAEWLIVSEVDASETGHSGEALSVSVKHCREIGYVRCPRCWRWVPVLEPSPRGEVCPRCFEALK